MKTTNTKGPWTWDDAEALKGPDNALVMGILRTPFEKIANRRLIAAAPDLLEACKFVLSQLAPDEPIKMQHKLYSDCLSPNSDDKTVVDYLREIVAKAEGNA